MNKINFDYVALTQALVKCPSVTPYDEGALQVVEDHLKDLGFESVSYTHLTLPTILLV